MDKLVEMGASAHFASQRGLENSPATPFSHANAVDQDCRAKQQHRQQYDVTGRRVCQGLLTHIADPAAKLFLNSQNLVDNLMRL